MAYALPIALHALTAETADGTGQTVDVGEHRSVVRASLLVAELTGAQLDVTLETSSDQTSWRALGALGTLRGIGRTAERTIPGCERYIRVTWDLTGTAVTFAVNGAAHQLYATPADIQRAHLPSVALEAVPEEQVIDALLAATDEAEGYLTSGHTLPLVSWNDDLRMHVAGLAAYSLMRSRGFDPTGSDALIVKGRDDAIAWLSKIAARKLSPCGLVDSTPSAGSSPAFARVRGTDESRGW